LLHRPPALEPVAARHDELRYDLGPLAHCEALEVLDCYATAVTNTAALAGLPRLRHINFYMSRVDSLAFARACERLRTLNLYGGEHTFANYAPLAALPELRELNVHMNPQATNENLAVLAELHSLRKISLGNSKALTHLDFLRNCRHLRVVAAPWCSELTDVSALAGLPYLEEVDLTDVPITDLEPFADKQHLERLDISGTQVAELGPLGSCLNLEYLNVKNTPVRELAPLRQLALEQFRELHVDEAVPEAERQALRERLPRLSIR